MGTWIRSAPTSSFGRPHRRTDDRLGFLCGFDSQTGDDVAYIHFVGVDSTARVECVTSPVNTDSLAFHHAMGFAGREVRDYDGPGEHRVVLAKELRT